MNVERTTTGRALDKKISKHKEVDFEDLMGVRVAGG